MSLLAVEAADHIRLIPSAADRAHFDAFVDQARAMPLYAETPQPDRLRRDFRAFADSPLARAMPAGVEMVRAGDMERPAWWFRPARQSREAPILYFHGGGYVGGSVEGARGVAGMLAHTFGANVLAPAYRQAPEAPFPAALDDARQSLAWLSSRVRAPITIAGDSAGAALAVLAALNAIDAGLRRPRAVIAICGIFDFAMSGQSWTRNRERDLVSPAVAPLLYDAYLAGAAVDHPDVSPLNRPVAGLPPLFIVSGSHELMADDSAMLAAHARRDGVSVRHEIYEGMPHNFIKFGGAVSDEAFRRIGAWEAALERDLI